MRYLWILLLCHLYLYASVGVVEQIKGTTFVLRESQKIVLNHGDELLNHDTISTTKNSKIRITLKDKTSIQMGPKSIFVIDDYIFTNKEKKANLSLAQGSLRFLSGKIGKIAPERFKIKTKSATIGIRGTDAALFYENDTLGLLYLGLGQGVYVDTNSTTNSHSELREVGQGVFVKRYATAPKAKFWTYEQSSKLLEGIHFSDEEIDEQISFSKSWKYGANVRFNAESINNKEHSNLLASIHVRSPFWNHLYVNTQLDGMLNVHDDNKSLDNVLALSLASLNYQTLHTHVQIGRIHMTSPLSTTAEVTPSKEVSHFVSWREGKSAYEWWFELPTTYEGADISYTLTPSWRLHASYLVSMKQARSEQFNALGDHIFSDTLSNDNNKTSLATLGMEYVASRDMKVQAWWYHLHNVFDGLYLQADYSYHFSNAKVLLSAQYLAQQSSGSLKQTINGHLFGLRASYNIAGLLASYSMTQTAQDKNGEINDILTPFEGAPAFTNSFTLRNRRSTFNILDVDGAYSAGVQAHQFSLGYDANYINIYGLEAFMSYTHYKKENFDKAAQASNMFFHYTLPSHDALQCDIKVAHVENSDFVSHNEDFVRIMFGCDF